MLEFFSSKDRSPGFKKLVIVSILVSVAVFGYIFYMYDKKDQDKMKKYVQEKRAERQKIMAERQKEAQKKQAQILAEKKPENLGVVIWKNDYPGEKTEENSQELAMIFLYSFLYGPYDDFTKGYNIMMQIVYRASSFPKMEKPPDGGPGGPGGSPGGTPGGPGGSPGGTPGGGPPKDMPMPYEISLPPMKDVGELYNEAEKKLGELESFNPETMDIKRKLSEVIALQNEMLEEIKKSPKEYEVVQKARQVCITCNKKMRTLHRFMLELCKAYPDTFSKNWLSFIQKRLGEWDKVVALDKKPIQYSVPIPKVDKGSPPGGMKPPGGGPGNTPGGQPPGGAMQPPPLSGQPPGGNQGGKAPGGAMQPPPLNGQPPGSGGQPPSHGGAPPRKNR